MDGTLEVKEGNTCTLFNEVILSLSLSLPAICCAAFLCMGCTQSTYLVPQEGKIVSKSKVKDAWGMPEGAELEMGNWELQVDAKMDEQQFRLVPS